MPPPSNCSFIFFSVPPTPAIYTLSLHDALPIYRVDLEPGIDDQQVGARPDEAHRSEEHTSELQSHSELVCRLLLEKKNNVLQAVVAMAGLLAGGNTDRLAAAAGEAVRDRDALVL